MAQEPGPDQGGGTSSSGMDMSKLGMPQKIVGGASGVFILVALILPFWKVCFGGGDILGTVVPNTCASGGNGLSFPVLLAFLAAVAAFAGVVMTAMGTKMPDMPMKPGMVQLSLAGVGVVATLLGLVLHPGAGLGGVGAGIGLYVAIIVSLVWAYGAFTWNKAES